MTINISGPDGSSFEFPPETPQDVISAAMQKHYGAPKAQGIDRTFGGDVEMQKQYKYAKQGANSITRRVYDSATLGAGDEIMAGISAAVETPFSRKTLGENYDRHLNVQRALRDDARADLDGAGGVAADIAGGMMMAPGNALASGARAAAPAITSWGQGLRNLARERIQNVPALAKAGATWGAGHAFLDTDGSADPNATLADNIGQRASAVPGGMVDGALGALVVGGGINTALGVRDIRRTLKGNRIQGQQLARMDAEAEGITPFGPAITENRTAARTAEGLADSVLGGSLRNAARTSIQQAEARVQQVLRQHTGGATANDMGEDIQRSLNRNMYEYSIPNREVQAMDNAGIERFSGPVTEQGFRPPRPTVDPVRPRDVPDVTPEQFAAERLPNRVKPVDPKVDYPDRSKIALPEDLQRRIHDNEAQQRGHSALAPDNHAELAAIKNKIDDLDNWYERGQYASNPLNKNRPMPLDMYQRRERLVARYNELHGSEQPWHDTRSALSAEAEALASAGEKHRSAAFVEQARGLHADAVKQASRETLSQNAAAETQYRRTQADAEAQRQTQAARDAANQAYDAELAANPSGFRVGRTRESYPTEFAAGYERVARETPSIQRNPLGGGGMSGSATPTATETLLNGFAREGRGQGLVQGYREGQAFGVDGRVLHPKLEEYLRPRLGEDVMQRISAYADYRAGGSPSPGIQGIRDLRTAVRRAAEDADRARMPGEMRTTDGAMLRRLEGALNEDLHAFQRQAGPQGERSSDMMRAVDTEYRNVAETLRRPLARLMGERVAPVEAMNRLSRAAEAGDTRMLSAFMRVMSEKDNPTRAAANIISHMTDGAPNIDAFLRGFRSLPADSRAVLFHGPEGQGLRNTLERLERVAGGLQRFQAPVATGGGIDFSRRSNLMLGVGAVAHVYATALAAGGLALTSRLMSSPRYVRWLTELPRFADRGWTSPDAMRHLARLSAMANSDAKRGDATLKQLADIALPGKVNAAPVNPRSDPNRFSLIEKTTFAGEKSKTADRNALAVAKELTAEGAQPDETWKATGWSQAKDGKWRTEVDDTGAKVLGDVDKVINMARLGDGMKMPLGMVIQHDELFKAYPALRNYTVNFFSEKKNPYIKGLSGYRDTRLNHLTINADMAAQDPKSLLDTLLHEIQHGIQDTEKFDYGKSKGLTDGYLWRPGEVESFDTEARRSMTKDQRRETPPAIIRSADTLEWGGGPNIRQAAKR